MESGLIIGGKYRLRREIGEGSMGSVWAGVHEMLGRSVAIKFLRPAFEDGETASARFVAEAKAAASIKHRFVVDVFDFGITEDGVYYMVQELLEGESLAESMYQGPAWAVEEAVRFSMQCLSGLEAVHQSGVIHRDLKPENIFVVREGDERFPKLLDFGISKSTQGVHALVRPSIRSGRPKRLTAGGATLGTPAYMSPEQLCNLSTLDGRADLYSMGVILYEWLSGRCPFATTANFAELHRQITERALVPLTVLRPDLGEPLCEIVQRALEPEPEHRFRSAAEMRHALGNVRAVLPSAWSVVQKTGGVAPAMGANTVALLEAAGDPFTASGTRRDPRGRRWFGAASAAAAIVTIGVAFAWMAGSERTGASQPPRPPVQPAPSRTTERAQRENHHPEPRTSDAVGDPLPLGAELPEDAVWRPTPLQGADPTEVEAPATRQPLRERVGHAHRRGPAQPAARTVVRDVDAGPARNRSAPEGSSAASQRPLMPGKVIRDLDF